MAKLSTTEVHGNLIVDGEIVNPSFGNNYLSKSGGTVNGNVMVTTLPDFLNVNPSITMALGDNDTGFNSPSDGNTEYWSNNVKRYNMNDVYHTGRKPDGLTGGNECSIQVTGSNDWAGLEKKNNVNIDTWWGISFSNKCGGQPVPIDGVGVSIDARQGKIMTAGDIRCEGRIYVQGQDLFQSVANGKSAIANAISGKGQSANGSMTFDQLASAINNISSSKGGGSPMSKASSLYKTGSLSLNNAIYIESDTVFYYVNSSFQICRFDINSMTSTATAITMTENQTGLAHKLNTGHIIFGKYLFTANFGAIIAKYGGNLKTDDTNVNLFYGIDGSSERYHYLYKLTLNGNSTPISTLLYSSKTPYLYTTEVAAGIAHNKWMYLIEYKYVDSTHYVTKVDITTGEETDVTTFTSYVHGHTIRKMNGNYYFFYTRSGSSSKGRHSQFCGYLCNANGSLSSVGSYTLDCDLEHTLQYPDNKESCACVEENIISLSRDYISSVGVCCIKFDCTGTVSADISYMSGWLPVVSTNKYLVMTSGSNIRVFNK